MKKIILSLTSLSIIGITATNVVSCDKEGKYMIKIWHLDLETGKPMEGDWEPVWQGDKRKIKRYAIDKSPSGSSLVKMELFSEEKNVRFSIQGNLNQSTKYLTDLIGFPPEPWWGTS